MDKKEAILKLMAIIESSAAGNIGMAECKDRKTGDMVPVVVASFHSESNGTTVYPIAKLFVNDPFDEIEPPEGFSHVNKPIQKVETDANLDKSLN